MVALANRAFRFTHSRPVRRALGAAIVIHALAFVLSPPFDFEPYEPPREPKQADPVRLVTTRVVFEPIEVTNPVEPDLPIKPAPPPNPPEPPGRPPPFPPAPGPPAVGPLPPSPPEFVTGPEVPPKLRHYEEPEYPDLALTAGFEGAVEIDVLVGSDGRVVEASVFRSEATGAMERAALEAARRCLFEPGLQRGRPVPARVRLRFRFRLP